MQVPPALQAPPAFATRVWVRRDMQQPDCADRAAGSYHACMPAPAVAKAEEPGNSTGAATATASCSPRAAWKFKVMSYNILSDVYAQHFAHWLYKDVPQHCLPWTYRLPLLTAEMVFWGSDIICLQEVSRFEDVLQALQPAGYEGQFLKRSGRRRDGCAIFWRSRRLRLLEAQDLEFDALGLEDNVALLVQLQPLEPTPACTPDCAAADEAPSSGSRLIVATTHICFDPNKGEVKLGQVRELMNKVDEQMRRAPGGAVAVIAGDFNFVPCCPIYDFMSKGQLDLTELSKRKLSMQVKGFGHQQFFQAVQASTPSPCTPPPPHAAGLQLWSQLPVLSLSKTSCAGAGQPLSRAPSAAAPAPPPCHEAPPAAAGSSPTATSAPPRTGASRPPDPWAADAPARGGAQEGNGFLAASRRAAPEPPPPLPPLERSPSAAAAAINRTWSLKAARVALGAEALEALVAAAAAMTQPLASHALGAKAAAAAGSEPAACGTHPRAVLAEPCALPAAEADHRAGTPRASADGGGGGGAPLRMRRTSSSKPREGSSSWGVLKESLVARHPLRLASSYSCVQGEEPLFTSVHSGFIGTCDYIWFTPHASCASTSTDADADGAQAAADGVPAGAGAEGGGGGRQGPRLVPLAVLAPPPIESLMQGLPAPAWGSDHVSIVCEFALESAEPAACSQAAGERQE